MAVLVCALLLVSGVLVAPPADRDDVTLYTRAATAIDQRQIDDAVEFLNRLVEQSPDSPFAELAAIQLAECWLIQQQPQRALQLLESWQPRLKESRTLMRLDDKAQQRADKLQQRAIRQLATLAESQQDYSAAISWWKKALALASEADRPRLRTEIVRSCIRACQSQPELTEQFILSVPESLVASARFGLAEAQRARGDVHRARRTLKPLEDVPQDWQACLIVRRCEALLATRQARAARPLLQAALRDHADDAWVHELRYLLARCWIAEINFEQATYELEQILASVPADNWTARARAAWTLGEVSFLRQRYHQAIQAYKQAIDLPAPEWQARALLQTARCQELLGNHSAAVPLYERIRKEFPEQDAAPLAVERIARLEVQIRQ